MNGQKEYEAVLSVGLQGYEKIWKRKDDKENSRRNERKPKDSDVESLLNTNIWKPVKNCTQKKEFRNKIFLPEQRRYDQNEEECPVSPQCPLQNPMKKASKTRPVAVAPQQEEPIVTVERSSEPIPPSSPSEEGFKPAMSAKSLECLNRIAKWQKKIMDPKPYLTLYQRERLHLPDSPAESPVATPDNTEIDTTPVAAPPPRQPAPEPPTSSGSTVNTFSDCGSYDETPSTTSPIVPTGPENRLRCNCSRSVTSSLGSYVTKSIEEYAGNSVDPKKLVRKRRSNNGNDRKVEAAVSEVVDAPAPPPQNYEQKREVAPPCGAGSPKISEKDVIPRQVPQPQPAQEPTPVYQQTQQPQYIPPIQQPVYMQAPMPMPTCTSLMGHAHQPMIQYMQPNYCNGMFPMSAMQSSGCCGLKEQHLWMMLAGFIVFLSMYWSTLDHHRCRRD